ncbi:hypothetical protein ACWDWO_07465 [Actinopolymorpha singaporensis]
MGGDQDDEQNDEQFDEQFDEQQNDHQKDAPGAGVPVMPQRPEPPGRRVPPRSDPPEPGAPPSHADGGRTTSCPDGPPAADERFEPL